MFVRSKKSGTYEYLQIVENQRIDGQVRQRVIATLGRLDVLYQFRLINALLVAPFCRRQRGAGYAKRTPLSLCEKGATHSDFQISVKAGF